MLVQALAEDLAAAGDLATDEIFDIDDMAEGRIVARKPGRVAGIDTATRVFTILDPRSETIVLVADGADVTAGTTLALVAGPTRALLTDERTCLNVAMDM